jgi:hypothetical protein
VGGQAGLASLMKDPQMMAMAQKMMQNPAALQQVIVTHTHSRTHTHTHSHTRTHTHTHTLHTLTHTLTHTHTHTLHTHSHTLTHTHTHSHSRTHKTLQMIRLEIFDCVTSLLWLGNRQCQCLEEREVLAALGAACQTCPR